MRHIEQLQEIAFLNSISTSVKSQAQKPSWVVIDEVQKIPKLLDIVHYLIENEKIKFALTGSSARKLKRGAANMLAGRAFMFELFPFTHRELGDDFDLLKYLSFGGLPAVHNFTDTSDKIAYLRAYVTTYLKEEIQAEQIVRQLKPFRLFLDIAAQSNAKIVNYSNIAKDVGVDTKTVQSYFEILQDTHVGVLLNSYHGSLRKRQKKNPKFYYFDTGVARSLSKRTALELKPSSFEYGDLFEQFLILEMHRLNSYNELDYSFSYMQTNNNLEVDIIIERPGQPTAMVEITSSENSDEEDIKSLLSLKKDYPQFEYFVLSNNKDEKIKNGIRTMPWRDGLKALGF